MPATATKGRNGVGTSSMFVIPTSTLTYETCPVCGKIFSRTPSHVYKLPAEKKRMFTYYCSYTCFRKAESMQKATKPRHLSTAGNNQYEEQTRHKVWDSRRAAGLCPYCGKNPPEEGRKMCTACRTRRVELTRARRLKQEQKKKETIKAAWERRGLTLDVGLEDALARLRA